MLDTVAQTLEINGRRIGPGEPVYVVAEMSANHNHDFDLAVRIIEAAAEAGADAIKLQTYTPDTLTLDCDRESFRIKGTLWDGRTLHDLYREAFTPWEWQPRLKKRAEALGLHCFSTPFDHTSVAFLEEMEMPAYKIASFEIVDLPLIAEVGRTGKPVLLSTGMSTLDEVDEAVACLRAAGNRELALLKCTSAYPAPPEEMNLKAMALLTERYQLPAGLSDHSLGIAVPVAAAALGATIIEKHLTLSRSLPGPDSAFSLEPGEFREMVEAVRTVERAVGSVRFELSEKEKSSRYFRRSLFVVEAVCAGERFSAQNIRSIRPGNGLHTRHLKEVVGRKATCDIPRGTPLGWDLVDKLETRSGSR